MSGVVVKARVKVKCAFGLIGISLGGRSSNVQVRLGVGDTEVFKTSVKMKDLNPVWDEEAEVGDLCIPVPTEGKFWVAAYHVPQWGGDDDFIGQGEAPLDPPGTDTEVKLGPRPAHYDEDRSLDKKNRGFGCVVVSWAFEVGEGKVQEVETPEKQELERTRGTDTQPHDAPRPPTPEEPDVGVPVPEDVVGEDVIPDAVEVGQGEVQGDGAVEAVPSKEESVGDSSEDVEVAEGEAETDMAEAETVEAEVVGAEAEAVEAAAEDTSSETQPSEAAQDSTVQVESSPGTEELPVDIPRVLLKVMSLTPEGAAEGCVLRCCGTEVELEGAGPWSQPLTCEVAQLPFVVSLTASGATADVVVRDVAHEACEAVTEVGTLRYVMHPASVGLAPVPADLLEELNAEEEVDLLPIPSCADCDAMAVAALCLLAITPPPPPPLQAPQNPSPPKPQELSPTVAEAEAIKELEATATENKWLIAPYEYHFPGQAPVTYEKGDPSIVRYVVRPPSGMDYSSPMYSNILGNGQKGTRAMYVRPVKGVETHDAVTETEMSMGDINLLEETFEEAEEVESDEEEDDEEPEECARRASTTSYASTHVSKSSKWSFRSGSSRGGRKAVKYSSSLMCPSPHCRAKNLTDFSSKGTFVKEVKYCGACGCHLQTNEPDGVMDELDTLRHELEAYKQEMLRMEKQLNIMSKISAQARGVPSGPTWSEAAAQQMRLFAGNAGLTKMDAAKAKRKKEHAHRKKVERDMEVYTAQMNRIRLKMYNEKGALFAAAEKGAAEVFMRLRKVDKGLDGMRGLIDMQGRTPLHIAALHGHLSVIVESLKEEHRADDTSNSEEDMVQLCFPAGMGRPSVFHSAVQSGKLALVEWLVNRFAASPKLVPLLSLKTKAGHTALDLSILHQFSHITAYLENTMRNLDKRRKVLRLTGNTSGSAA